jgi:hypothetical protein
MTRSVRWFPLLVCLIGCSALLGQSISEPSGVTLTVTPAGTFTVSSVSPAWTYQGSIPGHVNHVSGPVGGSDNNAMSTNGPFDQFTISSLDPEGNPWQTELRAYRGLPSVALSFSPLATVLNRRPYAVIHQFPITPHHFSNGGWNRAFGLVGWMDTDSPWLFYDDQFNASILSPGSRPMSERQVWVDDGSAQGAIALEIDNSNAVLPAGDVYSYLITFDQGIGKAFTTWGSTLRNMIGRPVTGNQSDLSMIIPMLSTDAGATYYYNFEQALGYEGTLQAVIASAKGAGIPIGVTHFDSWWYKKGGNCAAVADPTYASWSHTENGVWKYVMDPALFPQIDSSEWEEGFVQKLGPGMAHGRWVDPCSPYRLARGDGSRHLSDVKSVSGNVVIDPDIWARIAHTLHRSGVVIFEQDFLSTQARAANTFDDEKFINAMSTAMAKKGISLQFCMPLARHLLEAIQLENVHTLRVSGDRFNWGHWDSEMYGALVLNAGSVWPTVDNFQTTEQRNLLLAVLSAGPVALSDPIGAFIPIPQAIRNDGLILKPDVSLVPTDASFVTEAAAIEQYYGVNGATASNASNTSALIRPPLVAHTYSDFGGTRIEYVFAYSRDVTTPAQVTFSPQDFGFTSDVYLYDYFGQTGSCQSASQAIVPTVDSQGSYFVMTPVGPSGMAFLGDLSRFVTASQQRVSSLVDDGQITATLEFNAPETVPISVFAPSTPVVSADGATVSAPVLDAATGLYQITVTSTQNRHATIRIATGPSN